MKDISPRGWLILAAAAFCPGVTFGILILGFPFWVAPWTEEFGIARSVAMTAFTAGGLVMVLNAPLVGRALDFFSVRRCVALGALVMAVGIGLAALAQSYWQVLALFATLIPVGAAFAGNLPGQTLATRIYPQHAGLIGGVVNAGLALGGVLMATCASFLVADLGWRMTFLIAAGVLAVIVAPVAWFVFDAPEGRPANRNAPTPEEEKPAQVSAAGFSAIRSPAFWAIVGSMLPMMLALGAVPPNLGGIGKDLGFNIAATATLVGAMSLSSAVGGLAGGWISDRIAPWFVYLGMIGAAGGAVLAMSLHPNFIVMVTVISVLGFCGGMINPWAAAIVALRFGPEAFARVLGLIGPFLIPASFAPIAVAATRDTTGSYQLAYLFMGGLIIVGAATFPLLRRQPAPALASPAKAV